MDKLMMDKPKNTDDISAQHIAEGSLSAVCEIHVLPNHYVMSMEIDRNCRPEKSSLVVSKIIKDMQSSGIFVPKNVLVCFAGKHWQQAAMDPALGFVVKNIIGAESVTDRETAIQFHLLQHTGKTIH